MWDGLEPAELAAVVSGLTFESRANDDAPPPLLPNRRVLDVTETMSSLCTDLKRLEREHRLTYLREPDFGFAHVVWSWVQGASLDDVLRETEMAAGDFVRAMKQLIDVLAQVGDAAGAGRSQGHRACRPRPSCGAASCPTRRWRAELSPAPR